MVDQAGAASSGSGTSPGGARVASLRSAPSPEAVEASMPLPEPGPIRGGSAESAGAPQPARGNARKATTNARRRMGVPPRRHAQEGSGGTAGWFEACSMRERSEKRERILGGVNGPWWLRLQGRTPAPSPRRRRRSVSLRRARSPRRRPRRRLRPARAPRPRAAGSSTRSTRTRMARSARRKLPRTRI